MSTAAISTQVAIDDIFNAYDLSYIELSDEPGNGCEFNAYKLDDTYVYLPMDMDDDGCVDAIDWDVYMPLLLDYVYLKVGDYTQVEGRLTRCSTGVFTFKGNVTRSIDV